MKHARTGKWLLASILLLCLLGQYAQAAITQKRYYAYDDVEDKYGVIAPWYKGQNGQIDYRMRIAAETMKRYPWTDISRSVTAIPEYMYSSRWRVSTDGVISIPPLSDWANGDLGQRAAAVLCGWVDYYRYTGDPAAIAHITYMGDYLVDHCQTPADHPWPKLLISVPTKGKPYGDCNPKGHIQLDITSEVGEGLLYASQLTGNKRWFEAAKHWGDLLAEKCDRTPGAMPWPRYANPEDVKWKDNRETGGVAYTLYFLDELIRMGYTGKDKAIIKARDAGRAYLRDVLLPKWTVNDSFGINYWDWNDPVQAENVTEFACRYMMDNKDYFTNWRNDVRNITTLFFNHTSVNPASRGEVYSGAWAYPESSGCCGRSLWYGPMEVSWAIAQYAVEANSEWAREIARRSQILATYDIHDNGYSEDNIDGGTIVNGEWFKIAHPMALKHMLETIGWLPELFAPSRENHIVRSTSTVTSVVYAVGRVEFATYDAPENTTTVLRLAFTPDVVGADGDTMLVRSSDLKRGDGYTVKRLGNGDCILTIRHDGFKKIIVRGKDPQQRTRHDGLSYSGVWTQAEGAAHVSDVKGAAASLPFEGNQVRLVGSAGPDGGLADAYLDDQKQIVGIDSWNPEQRKDQVLYYKNGLSNGKHTLKVVVRGEGNPQSKGARISIGEVQWSDATGSTGYGEGGGPKDTQRMIFGYTGRQDYRDSQGHLWRPGTEFVVRMGALADSVKGSWWTTPATAAIENTKDPELYRYGVHASDFTVNVTVGPGVYHVRLKLVSSRVTDPALARFSIAINGTEVVKNLDLVATAGGPNRAADLVFSGISPRNGVIDIRFTGVPVAQRECSSRSEAFVQAIEVGPGDGGEGAKPVTATVPEGPANLLTNGGFEDDISGDLGASNKPGASNGWNYLFISKDRSYAWPEAAYVEHPDWGLPEFHCGSQAIRTHTDKNGHTQIYQDVDVEPNTRYVASVWIRAADLRGKGFGKADTDSAGLIVEERDSSGRAVLLAHPKLEVKQAGPYVRKSLDFATGPDSRRVRFLLDTVIACPYNEGHVTYDDCTLLKQVN